MRITFILPFVHPGGGVRVIFEHTVRLNKKGHNVEIIYPGPDGVTRKYSQLERSLRMIKYKCDSFLGRKEYTWFDKDLPVKRVPDLRAIHIPDSDIVIATSNEVADWVNYYPKRCGKRAYFIQDYEYWSRAIEKVDQTWLYPMYRIVISDWLKDLARSKFYQQVEGVVPNGIDLGKFYPDPDIQPSERSIDIAMIYSRSSQKGCNRALKILTEIKKERPNTKIVFFGVEEAYNKVKKIGDYYLNPSQDLIRKIYSSSRLFLLPSLQEGYCLTRMEAAACGTAVVTTDVGAELDLFINSGWVVSKNNDMAIKAALEEALDRDDLCDQYSVLAREKVANCSWDNATDILEKILLKIHQNV